MMKKLLVLLLTFATVNTMAQVNLTIQVDMTGQILNDPAYGVSVRGDFPHPDPGGGAWWPPIQMTDPDGDMIYSVTLPVDPQGTYEYVIANGSELTGTAPSFTPGPAVCTANNNYYVDMPGGDYTVPPIPLGGCPPLVNVVYSVDMTSEIAKGTFAAGSPLNTAGGARFPACGASLVDDGSGSDLVAGDNIYTGSLDHVEGAFVKYKFNTGDCASFGWESSTELIAGGCNFPNFDDRGFTVPTGLFSHSLDVVCFGQCTATCPATVDVTYSVDMTSDVTNATFDPATQEVFVAGGNFWPNCGIQLADPDGDLIYEGIATHGQGEYIEYKFYKGNVGFTGAGLCDWSTGAFEVDDDTANAGSLALLGCGNAISFDNRFFTAPNMDTYDLPVVCYASCILCNAVPTVSEWGLMVLAMMLLILGTLGLTYLAPQGRLSTGQTMSFGGFMSNPPFNKATFAKCLLATLGLALVAGGLSFFVYGHIAMVDIIGTAIAAPIFAYMTHLWVKK